METGYIVKCTDVNSEEFDKAGVVVWVYNEECSVAVNFESGRKTLSINNVTIVEPLKNPNMTYTLTRLQLTEGVYVAEYHSDINTPLTRSRIVSSEALLLEVIFQIRPEAVLLSGSKEEILGQ